MPKVSKLVLILYLNLNKFQILTDILTVKECMDVHGVNGIIIDIFSNPHTCEDFFVEPMSMKKLLESRLTDHINMFTKIAGDDELKSSIIAVGERIVESLKASGRILLCGNGGSASDAQHIAAEFVGRFQKERKAYDAEALTVNTSTLTSVGNDYGYNSIFSRQVEAKGRPGDVLIGISTSGTSANVVEALKRGKEQGLITVLLKGSKDNDELSSFCDYVISAPSSITARVQEGHIFIGHMLAEIVEEML